MGCWGLVMYYFIASGFFEETAAKKSNLFQVSSKSASFGTFRCWFHENWPQLSNVMTDWNTIFCPFLNRKERRHISMTAICEMWHLTGCFSRFELRLMDITLRILIQSTWNFQRHLKYKVRSPEVNFVSMPTIWRHLLVTYFLKTAQNWYIF